MNSAEIMDYARRLKESHGDKAIAEAAQKAKDYEDKGDAENAALWRRIESALAEMQGPHSS